MRGFVVYASLAAAVCGATAWVPLARAEDKERTADQIVKEIDAVATPPFNPAMRNDRPAATKFLAARQAAAAQRSLLIEQLYNKDPENAQLAKFMPERWQALLMTGPEKL